MDDTVLLWVFVLIIPFAICLWFANGDDFMFVFIAMGLYSIWRLYGKDKQTSHKGKKVK